jgi:hypothetical protein
MEQHIIGLIFLGVMFIAVVASGAMVLFAKTGGYNPFAKHYCAICGELEHECYCNSC